VQTVPAAMKQKVELTASKTTPPESVLCLLIFN
jgi:hypothetical protein